MVRAVLEKAACKTSQTRDAFLSSSLPACPRWWPIATSSASCQLTLRVLSFPFLCQPIAFLVTILQFLLWIRTSQTVRLGSVDGTLSRQRRLHILSQGMLQTADGSLLQVRLRLTNKVGRYLGHHIQTPFRLVISGLHQVIRPILTVCAEARPHTARGT